MHHALTDATLYITFFISLYFEVFLLIHFLEKRKGFQKIASEPLTVFPHVTIIVPAFNEEKTIERTIDSLLHLNYPKEKVSIIVVNDGSTDNTAHILTSFASEPRIKIMHKKNGGKYTALNCGIALTTSPYVGCLDADSFVPPDTLQKIIAHFTLPTVMAVTPTIRIHKPKGIIRHVQSNEYDLGIFMKKSLGLIDAINVTPGPFSFFRKSVFDTLGVFHEAHHTEDLEIAMRMQKNHYKITNAHNAVVYTVGPATCRSLIKQRVRWIYGFLQNAKDYRSLFFKKQHGNLGLFTLPLAIVSIPLFFASVGVVLWNFATFIEQKITEITVVGFSWHVPHFNWFYINTDSKMFLGLILFVSTVSLITYGKFLSEKKWHFSAHTLYFPFVYSLLATIWLSKAVYASVLSRKVTWR